MHPMKRPRRPAKRVASKKTEIVKRKKPSKAFKKIKAGLDQALAHARAVPEWTAEDAAVFDIPKSPPGFAYQWAPVASTFRMELKGWGRVPFSRHAELGKPLNFDGYIVYRGMALFQISSDLVREALAAARNAAISQGQLGNIRMSGDYGGGFGSTPGFGAIMPGEWIESEALPETEPLEETEISIKFMMPKNWPSGAAACRLDLAEYIRRRLLQSGHLLTSGEDGVYSIVRLTTEKVDF
jgi:hypothetical protein